MADPAPAVATPATPAGTPPPQDGTAQRPHHSATQPRTDVGTFDKKTAPPQEYEIEGRKVSVAELKAALTERQVDERAARAEREELQRLRQESQRWQRPEQALTREQRREIARLELLEFKQQQDEAALPPEQRAFRQEQRRLAEEREAFRREREEAGQQAQHAAQAQEREQAANNVQAALKALGTTDADSVALRMVVDEFWAASSRGKQYPPEVIARRVQRQLDAIASQRAVKMGPKAMLGNAEFVAALNGLDDADLLKALAPLGERLRALNLQTRGITAPAAAMPSNVVPLPTGQSPRTDAEWIQHFRANGAPDPSNGAAHTRYWNLKDRGVL
jgi:hypothetical protein